MFEFYIALTNYFWSLNSCDQFFYGLQRAVNQFFRGQKSYDPVYCALNGYDQLLSNAKEL